MMASAAELERAYWALDAKVSAFNRETQALRRSSKKADKALLYERTKDGGEFDILSAKMRAAEDAWAAALKAEERAARSAKRGPAPKQGDLFDTALAAADALFARADAAAARADDLFHGTPRGKEVEAQGLDPAKSPFKTNYLTSSRGEASKYSKGRGGVVGSVFKVRTEDLDPNSLKKDPTSGIYQYSKHIPPDKLSKS